MPPSPGRVQYRVVKRSHPARIVHHTLVRVLSVLSVLSLGLIGVGGAVPASASGTGQVIYAPLTNPSANIAPNPNFYWSGTCTQSAAGLSCVNPCFGPTLQWIPGGNTVGCANYILLAINNARATLGESALVLPSNWISLTPPEQLFTIADMERTAAGYPPYVGLNDTLSAEAQIAANANGDPGLAPGFAVGNNPWGNVGIGGAWAGTDDVLTADYGWMYDDGWNGPTDTFNVACTSPTALGCWGHRDELLGSGEGPYDGVGLGCTTCVMGAGAVLGSAAHPGSLVDLIELPTSSPVPMSFTWAQELPFFSSLPTPASPPVAANQNPHAATGQVSVRVLSWNAHGLRVVWSLSSGASSSDEVIALPFLGRGCRLGQYPVQQATNGAQRGVVIIPFARHFRFGARYSVRLDVGDAAGVARAPCLNLPILRPLRHHR